jgi:hypothetical protein
MQTDKFGKYICDKVVTLGAGGQVSELLYPTHCQVLVSMSVEAGDVMADQGGAQSIVMADGAIVTFFNVRTITRRLQIERFGVSDIEE